MLSDDLEALRQQLAALTARVAELELQIVLVRHEARERDAARDEDAEDGSPHS